MNIKLKIEIFDIVSKNGDELRYLASSFKNDPDIVLAAVKNTGTALQFASKELQNNFDIVHAAVSQNGYAIRYASDVLKKNRQILLACCKTRPDIINLSELNNELKSDEELILAVLEANSKNWQYVSKELRTSPNFILKALEAKGHLIDAQSHWNIIFEHASPDLRNNRDFYLIIVQNNYKYLRYMGDFRKDRDFVLDIVKLNGNAIKFASPDLQNDPIILMEAVIKGGFRLANAPLKIINNITNIDMALFNQNRQSIQVEPFGNSNRRFLNRLNGRKNGEFKKFIEQNKNPRIAWYPSAGEDFRPLLFLQENYQKLNPPLGLEPVLPDILIFTDIHPWSDNWTETNHLLFKDRRTTVTIEHMESLPKLSRSQYNESIHRQYHGNANDKVVYLVIKLSSDCLETITFPVLYVCTSNESFCCDLFRQRVSISHIILVRYGGTGSWLSNVLQQLNCELFISDRSHECQADLYDVQKVCDYIPNDCNAVLTPIRVTPGEQWSNHGDVFWYLVN